MENLSDQQLIQLYFEGNPKAFEGIINRYSKPLYRFTYSILYDKDSAYEAVQDTFIRVWKNLRKYNKEKSFKTWIFIIAKRICIDILRKKKNVDISLLDEDIIDESILPDDFAEQQEEIEITKEALNKLNINEKTIVLLHDGEDMTFEEIADIVERPMNTIKSQYRRALIKLRDYIAPKLS